MFWRRKESSRENKQPSGIEVTAVYNTKDTIGGIEEGGSSGLDRFYFLASSSSPQLAAKVRELNSQPNIHFNEKISILNGIQREASITLIYPYQDESGNLKAIISNRGDNICLVIRNGLALKIEEDPREQVDLDEVTQILVLNQELVSKLKPKKFIELANPKIVDFLENNITKYTQKASMLVIKSKIPTKIEETNRNRTLTGGQEGAVSEEQISRIQNSQDWYQFLAVLREIGTVTDRRYQYDYNYFDNCYRQISSDPETVDKVTLPITYGIKDKFRELAYEDLIKALVSSMQSLEDLANLISYLYNKRLNLKNDQNKVLKPSTLQVLVWEIFNDGNTNAFNQIPTRYGLRQRIYEICSSIKR